MVLLFVSSMFPLVHFAAKIRKKKRNFIRIFNIFRACDFIKRYVKILAKISKKRVRKVILQINFSIFFNIFMDDRNFSPKISFFLALFKE